MFWNLLANENAKNIKRNMLWIQVAIIAGLLLMINLVIYASLQLNVIEIDPGTGADPRAQMQATLTWPGIFTNSLGFARGNVLGGMMIVILVAAATANEYQWGTLQLWLSRGLPRPTVMLAKFVSMVVPALLFVLAAVLAGGLIGAVFTLMFEGSLPLAEINWAALGLSVLRSTYILLPYAALSFLLAIVGRSVVLAISGGMVFSLLIEGLLIQMLSLLGGTISRLGNFLPTGLSNSVLALNSATGADTAANLEALAQNSALAPLPAAIGIALWTLLFLGLALWVFQRQDLGN